MEKTKEAKMQEAVKRMKMMGVFPQTIEQFQQGYVSISEPPFGAFYWADESQQELISKFEREHNAVVYVGILTYTSIGKMLSLLYVSDYPEEWKAEKECIEEGIATAYVYNYDAPDCSEIGDIGFKRTPAAGLARTC